MDYGSRLVSRNQRSVRLISSVDECFSREGDPGAFGGTSQLAPGGSQQGQGRFYAANCCYHRGRCFAVSRSPVVQRAVRLYVGQLCPFRSAHVSQRTDLVSHMARYLFRRNAKRAPAETGHVGIRRVRANCDTPKRCRSHCVSHCRRVPGVEATGDVGGGYEVKQRLVLRGAGATKALPQVRGESYAKWQAGEPLFLADFLLAVHRLGLDDLPRLLVVLEAAARDLWQQLFAHYHW